MKKIILIFIFGFLICQTSEMKNLSKHLAAFEPYIGNTYKGEFAESTPENDGNKSWTESGLGKLPTTPATNGTSCIVVILAPQNCACIGKQIGFNDSFNNPADK